MNLDLVTAYWWQFGLIAAGLLLLVRPASRRFVGKHRVVEPAGAFAAGGCGAQVLGLALLGFGGWRTYQDYWLVHYPRLPADPGQWHEVRTVDGLLTARFPALPVSVKGATGAAWTAEVGKGFHVAVVDRQVPPGSGYLQPTNLAAMYQGIQAVPDGVDFALARVVRQEAIRTSATSGYRLVMDLPGHYRFQVQNYRVGNRLLAVSLHAPSSVFEKNTAETFFDTITLANPALPAATSPAAGERRLAPGATSATPQRSAPTKEPERRFGPKPGVKGLRD